MMLKHQTEKSATLQGGSRSRESQAQEGTNRSTSMVKRLRTWLLLPKFSSGLPKSNMPVD